MAPRMSEVPLVLQKLSRAEMLDARAWSAPRGALTLPELDWQVTVDAARESRCGPTTMSVGVTWGEHRLTLRCPGELIDVAMKRLDPGLATMDRPSDLTALLIEAALLPALTAAEHATGRDIRLTSARLEVEPVPDERLALQLGDGERTWGLRIDATRETVTEILSVWPVAPHAMGRLPVPAALRIGTTRLTLGAARSLGPDDAVLLEIGRGDGGGMLVVADAWLAEAARHEGGWKLEGRLRSARSRNDVEWTMQDGENGTDETESIGEVDDLPVRLAFDVGRLDITLGELRRLDVGSILDIGRDASDLVRISVNGKLVGQGTLMDVEGKIAVRIMRMFDNG